MIRILLADDQALVRAGFRALLDAQDDMQVIGEAVDGDDAVRLATSLMPDVVLMDIEMPQMNGIEATRKLLDAMPDLKVVILTKFGDDENLFAAIKAGATGYLLKDSGLDEIQLAVREAHAGEGHLNPALVTRLLLEFGRISRARQETRQLFAELTRREIEVLELLSAGMKNRAIGEKLFLTEKTVKHHIGSILRKLHVNGRTEAALIAQQHGLSAEVLEN